MGLDVYVGSLTRYYAGDWETVVQRFGRESGMPVKVIRPNDPEDAIRNPEIIRPAVIEWRNNISKHLKHSLPESLDWNEDEGAPYFTDKPTWDCYSSLLIWTAHEEQPQFPKPKEHIEDWSSDPAFQASNEEGFESRYSQLLGNVELWLPCKFEFTFLADDVAGNEINIGSSIALFSQLRELNKRTWKTDGAISEEWLRQGAEHQAPLEVGARFAFALFMKLTRASIEHRIPMKLDY
jgi:hypothetical protein